MIRCADGEKQIPADFPQAGTRAIRPRYRMTTPEGTLELAIGTCGWNLPSKLVALPRVSQENVRANISLISL